MANFVAPVNPTVSMNRDAAARDNRTYTWLTKTQHKVLHEIFTPDQIEHIARMANMNGLSITGYLRELVNEDIRNF